MCQKLGIPTHAQAVAQRATSRIAAEMGEGTLLVDAHSQGVETVHNLSSDLKKKMSVNAYGGARVLR